jgi:hypothetical protein
MPESDVRKNQETLGIHVHGLKQLHTGAKTRILKETNQTKRTIRQEQVDVASSL